MWRIVLCPNTSKLECLWTKFVNFNLIHIFILKDTHETEVRYSKVYKFFFDFSSCFFKYVDLLNYLSMTLKMSLFVVNWDVIHWLWTEEGNLKILFPSKFDAPLSSHTHTHLRAFVFIHEGGSVCETQTLSLLRAWTQTHEGVCVCTRAGIKLEGNWFFKFLLLRPKGGEYHLIRHVLPILVKWSSLLEW